MSVDNAALVFLPACSSKYVDFEILKFFLK